ncbi:MAG: chloride channel protein, partial [bacterium]|nr:chloride channel protein [bacterium]
GIGVIQGIIFAQYPKPWAWAALFLMTLAVLKMIATSLTLQSGGSGGVLIPSLFIGARLGGFFGTVCHHFFPTLVPDVTPFIVVGMAAFFSSVTNASLGALVMVTEMTGGYELLPPLMIVAVISLITSHKWSIYRNQVTNKFFSQAHLWDMNPMNLKPVSIGSAFRDRYHRRAVITPEMTLGKIEDLTHETHATDFLIKKEDGELVGIFSLKDLSSLEEDLRESKKLLVAGDLISRPLFYLTEENTLYDAMKYLMDSDFDKVPIARVQNGRPYLLGYLRHQDILESYYKMGLQHQASPLQASSK